MSNTRKITIIVVVALLAVGLVIAICYARSRSHTQHCEGIEIVLEESPGQLLSVPDINRFISQRHLDPTGQLCDSIDLARIENELATMPLVDCAECCILRNGTLQINVSQRCPLFHVRTNVSDYCIDANGRQMLTPQNIPDSVIRVSGDVTIAFATDHIYPLVRFLYANPELVSEFRRLSVGRGNQINLYSNRYPYHLTIAGNDRFEPAFEKFQSFRAWDESGEYQKKYKSINLQFRGQIVCKRIQ